MMQYSAKNENLPATPLEFPSDEKQMIIQPMAACSESVLDCSTVDCNANSDSNCQNGQAGS